MLLAENVYLLRGNVTHESQNTLYNRTPTLPTTPTLLLEQPSRPSKTSQNTPEVLSYELPCLNPLV
jgi:hypothetical protein